MAVQNCCKGRSKKYMEWHFSGYYRRETLNRLIQFVSYIYSYLLTTVPLSHLQPAADVDSV